MISESRRYWSTGITVECLHGNWGASIDFYDSGFANDDTDSGAISTEGRLHTRYLVADGEKVSGLSLAIDTVIADATRLGIVFRNGSDGCPPMLYYPHDSPTADHLALLQAEAIRIGWYTYDCGEVCPGCKSDD